MKTKTLLTCDNPQEAHLLQGRLENEGIECFLTNENISTILPYLNQMLSGGVQIMVSEEDYEKARQIVSDKIDPKNEELVCSECGSKDIKLGVISNKVIIFFSLIVALLMAMPFGNIKPHFYCRKCKHQVA
jgi:hypothetical protein